MTAVAGSHVVVTGGSSGIGLATALECARRGARVSLIARDRDRLDEAASGMRPWASVRTASADVSDTASLSSAIASLTDAHGPGDVLVTSAGASRPGRFWELEDRDFLRLMTVNYFGTLNAVREVLPSMMQRRRGSIVGVSSAAALVGVYGYSAYGASKFAVRGLLESLRGEVKPYGIHVGCAVPPDVDTPMLWAEDEVKPVETAAISGGIRALEPQKVAVSIVDGIERERFWIVPDWRTAALVRLAGAAWEPLQAGFDRVVRRVQRQHGQG
ncbi:MAG: Fatty acyl-CoA reductase [Acidimicrobiales bacterium]|nr:MAG: SDR family NAD(P)-dependent oxidoreductase [Actinomycetota bacterium]MBV6509435.1 Fatty acyl-CoA reductase [Acidimicrobiales bacterium]RIK06751.1 MAG: short-chain dehydrogenase [Acidobacteriota bacterium]